MQLEPKKVLRNRTRTLIMRQSARLICNFKLKIMLMCAYANGRVNSAMIVKGGEQGLSFKNAPKHPSYGQLLEHRAAAASGRVSWEELDHYTYRKRAAFSHIYASFTRNEIKSGEQIDVCGARYTYIGGE